MRIDEKGVSPVIATIMMVAITVVLAATVWIMATQYTSSLPQSSQVPKFTGDVKVGLHKQWVNFTVENNPIRKAKLSEFRYVYVDSIKINITANLQDISKNYAFWNDTNGDGYVSMGDVLYIHLKQPLSSGSHPLKIVHLNGVACSEEFKA